MGHAAYTPNSHNWRIYAIDDSTAKAAQNVKPTGIGETEALVIHLCIHETGGDSDGTNKALDLEYSDDLATWYSLGAQLATDKKFRWDDNPNLTEHETTTVKLTCGVAEKVHEAACSDFDGVAGSHDEVALAIESYSASSLTTYYFRIKLNGLYPPLEDPPNSYPQLTMEEIVGPEEGDEINTKLNENINQMINNGIN